MIIIEGYEPKDYPPVVLPKNVSELDRKEEYAKENEFYFHQETLENVFAPKNPKEFESLTKICSYFRWWFLGLGALVKNERINELVYANGNLVCLEWKTIFELYLLKFGSESPPVAYVILSYTNDEYMALQLLALGYG